MKSKYNMSFLKVVCTILFFDSCFCGFGQKSEKQKSDIIFEEIISGAKYITDVLQDENGKSKCEYSIIDGTWNDYEPAWHTGQLIYALCRAYEKTGNKFYLESARKAGDWWCSLEIKSNPPLNRMVNAIHGSGINFIVFATVTDGTAGLFRLAKITGNPEYGEVPVGAGDWMIRNMYLPADGLCYDMVDPVSGEVQKTRSAFWPDKKEQILTDVARPNNEGSFFLDLFRFTGKSMYRDVFLNLSKSLVNKQDKDGLWMDFTPNDKEEHSIHPRFNLWYAESLIDAYNLTGDKKFLEGALKTALYYRNFQSKDGTFYYTNFNDGTPPDKSSVSGSTVAFAGIIYIRLAELGYKAEFEKNIDKCFDWLKRNKFSRSLPDLNLRGAIVETKVKMTNGKAVLINRDLGTIFAVRFFADYFDYLSHK
jgi:rhamnogalacturonyl hydrolase YesR